MRSASGASTCSNAPTPRSMPPNAPAATEGKSPPRKPRKSLPRRPLRPRDVVSHLFDQVVEHRLHARRLAEGLVHHDPEVELESHPLRENRHERRIRRDTVLADSDSEARPNRSHLPEVVVTPKRKPLPRNLER